MADKDVLLNLREHIADHLEAIRKMFKGNVKITLLVRNIINKKAHVELSDDDLETVVETMRELHNDDCKDVTVIPGDGARFN
jgi:hypothetical protein